MRTSEQLLPVSIDQPVAETTGDLDWENTPDGELMYTSVGPLTLDNGERLDDVTLAFQRWLNLPGDGSVAASIEVSDGATWHRVWVSAAEQDAATKAANDAFNGLTPTQDAAAA